jgi:hypothetical protein
MAHFDVRPAIQAENPGFTLGSKPAPGRDTLARAVEWLIRWAWGSDSMGWVPDDTGFISSFVNFPAVSGPPNYS